MVTVEVNMTTVIVTVMLIGSIGVILVLLNRLSQINKSTRNQQPEYNTHHPPATDEVSSKNECGPGGRMFIEYEHDGVIYNQEVLPTPQQQHQQQQHIDDDDDDDIHDIHDDDDDDEEEGEVVSSGDDEDEDDGDLRIIRDALLGRQVVVSMDTLLDNGQNANTAVLDLDQLSELVRRNIETQNHFPDEFDELEDIEDVENDDDDDDEEEVFHDYMIDEDLQPRRVSLDPIEDDEDFGEVDEEEIRKSLRKKRARSAEESKNEDEDEEDIEKKKRKLETPAVLPEKVDNQKDDVSFNKSCAICREYKVSTVILDCNHSCLCRDCANNLLKNEEDKRKCPICQRQIEKGIIDSIVS